MPRSRLRSILPSRTRRSENCSLLTAEVRKACTELMEKIAGPATDRAPKPKKVEQVDRGHWQVAPPVFERSL